MNAGIQALTVLMDRVALLEEWYAITSSAGRVINHDDNGETMLSFDHSTATELQRIDYALTPVVQKVPV